MATLPVALGAKGHPPASADAGVEGRDPRLDGRHRVGHSGVAGVVKVHPQRHVRTGQLASEAEASLHVGRHGDPDGVGQGQFVCPCVDDPLDDLARVGRLGTSPSKGQPKDAPTVIVEETPAARASATSSAAVSQASAVLIPWLRWQKVSVATTTTSISSTFLRQRPVEPTPVHDEPGVR